MKLKFNYIAFYSNEPFIQKNRNVTVDRSINN